MNIRDYEMISIVVIVAARAGLLEMLRDPVRCREKFETPRAVRHQKLVPGGNTDHAIYVLSRQSGVDTTCVIVLLGDHRCHRLSLSRDERRIWTKLDKLRLANAI